MAKRLKFTLSFAPEAIEHLAAIDSKYHGLLRRTIKELLTYNPTEETRNRKPLEQPAPFESSWELRCGPDNRFRIFYDVVFGVSRSARIGRRRERSQPAFDWRGGVRAMRIAPLADVKARLSAYVNECEAEGPIVITRNGKPVAVLLAPYDNDDLERLMLGRSPRFRTLLDRSRKSIQEGKGLSEKEFWEVVRKGAQKEKAAPAKHRRFKRST